MPPIKPIAILISLLVVCARVLGTPLVGEHASTPAFAPGEQSPVDAAFLPDGSLVYACSRTKSLHSITPDKPGRATQLAVPGLGEPSGLHVDADGTITIADYTNHQVMRWKPGQRGAMHFGSFGHGAPHLCKPSDVAVDGELIVVADTGNSRVQVFDTAGNYVRTIGGWGRDAEHTVRPVGVAIHDGHIFVADEAMHRINVYTTDGEYVRSIGSPGEQGGLLLRPTRIDIHSGTLYVADSRNHRVQAFDIKSAELLGRFGEHAIRPREHTGKLETPTSVVISPDGKRAAVCEQTEGRVQLFDIIEPRNTPPVLAGLGTTHFDRFMAGGPDTIVLASPDLQTVEVYDLSRVREGNTPIMITRFGSQGWGFGKFARIAGLAFDEAKQLVYVTDAAQRRLSIWKLDRKPADESRFVPTMARLVQTLDFTKLRETDERMQEIAPFVPGAVAVSKEHVAIGDERAGSAVVFNDKFSRCIPHAPNIDRAGIVHQVDAIMTMNGTFFALDGVHKPRPLPLQSMIPDIICDEYAAGYQLNGFDGTVSTSIFGSTDEWTHGPGTPGGVAIADLMEPTDICAHGDALISVLDYANHRVIFLDAHGEPVSILGARPFVMDAQKELKDLRRARDSE